MLFYFVEIAKQKMQEKEPTEEMKKAWDCMHVEYIDKVRTLEYKLGRL